MLIIKADAQVLLFAFAVDLGQGAIANGKVNHGRDFAPADDLFVQHFRLGLVERWFDIVVGPLLGVNPLADDRRQPMAKIIRLAMCAFTVFRYIYYYYLTLL